MVCLRMGLLDDAIREHLELKRRRGADPGEVAREQREALEPVPREQAGDVEQLEQDAPLGDGGQVGEQPVATPGAAPVAARPMAEDPGQARTPQETAATDVEETAELDMREVLGDDDDAGPVGDVQPPVASAEQASPSAGEALVDEDSLEWEVPGEVAEDAPEAEDADEDVLEETPDFLRDTPEQERLWFEQHPPRDFDFDK
jgi:hypothetical protein